MTRPTDPATGEHVLRIPDLGGVQDVTVLEVLVKPGDRVEVDTPLATLESDKATMDVPATAPGVIGRVMLKPGDKVAAGTTIATLVAVAARPASDSTDDTRVVAALRASEPYGGEPYLDTVPIRPMSKDAPAASAPAAKPGASVRPAPVPAPAPAARPSVRQHVNGSSADDDLSF